MAIIPGQPVTAAVVNAEFASKVDNTSFAGIVSFNNTTESTDKDTGGAVFNGGVGIEKNVNIGGNLSVGANVNSTDKDTGALVVQFGGLGVEQNINAGGNILGANLSGTNTGDLTIAPVGASPSVNGMTLSGQVLNLEPADLTNPGVVTTGSQSFAGAKSFVDLNVTGFISTWKKYTISHSALQTAALSNSLTVASFTDCFISAIILKHTVAASGTGVTSYELSVGVDSETDRYLNHYDAMTAVSNVNHETIMANDIPKIGASFDLKLTAVSNVNLDQSTAGSFDIYLKLDKLV